MFGKICIILVVSAKRDIKTNRPHVAVCVYKKYEMVSCVNLSEILCKLPD